MTTMHENYESDAFALGTKTVFLLTSSWLGILFFKKWFENQFVTDVFLLRYRHSGTQFRRLRLFGMMMIAISMGTMKAQAPLSSDSAVTNQLTLRPLSILSEIAIQNSPVLKANRNDVARQTLAWKIQKRSWADIVSMSGTTLYGNGSVIDASNAGSGTSYILSDKKTFSANISVGFRLTGSDFLVRSSKAEMQKLQLERLKTDQEQLEMAIRDNVTTLYTQLELALKIVQLKGEALETQRMALSVAEKYYKEGNSQPLEFSAMLSKVTSAEEQYEQAKSETKKLVLLLKNLVGDTVWE